MLQRATPGLYSPNRWGPKGWAPNRWAPGRLVNWRRGLLAGPTSALLKYVAVVALVTAIGCAYVWQAAQLRLIQLETYKLRDQRVQLEQANVNLVNQLAQWNAPHYVASQATAQGYVAPKDYVLLDDPAAAPLVAQGAADSTR